MAMAIPQRVPWYIVPLRLLRGHLSGQTVSWAGVGRFWCFSW